MNMATDTSMQNVNTLCTSSFITSFTQWPDTFLLNEYKRIFTKQHTLKRYQRGALWDIGLWWVSLATPCPTAPEINLENQEQKAKRATGILPTLLLLLTHGNPFMESQVSNEKYKKPKKGEMGGVVVGAISSSLLCQVYILQPRQVVTPRNN